MFLQTVVLPFCIHATIPTKMYISYNILNTTHCKSYIHTGCCTFLTSHYKHPKCVTVALKMLYAKMNIYVRVRYSFHEQSKTSFMFYCIEKRRQKTYYSHSYSLNQYSFFSPYLNKCCYPIMMVSLGHDFV